NDYESIAPINRRTETFCRGTSRFYLSVSERTAPECRRILRYGCIWLSGSRAGLSGETKASAVPLFYHRLHFHAECTGNRMGKAEPPCTPGLSEGVPGRYV